MYKKYMGKFQVTKDHEAIMNETLFFDTEEEIKEFVKNENVRIEVVFELVQKDTSKYFN